MTDYNTNPTIETVLEKIEALHTEMNGRFDSLRNEMRQGFAMVEAKLDRLNRRLLDMEGTSDLHDKRIASLEDRT
jgi:hypothetical protein